MKHDLTYAIGIEWELIAPKGKNRLDLAQKVKDRVSGQINPFFIKQQEPNVKNRKEVFHNLTQGFKVSDAEGDWVCSMVDDITLQGNFDKSKASAENWYRIISNDSRLLRLCQNICLASAPRNEVLEPLAKLYNSKVEPFHNLLRVCDMDGQAIAAAAPYPGERERACELITAPLKENQWDSICLLLSDAEQLNFHCGKESATHFHFDGEEFMNVVSISRLIQFFAKHRNCLMKHFGTNPENVRIAPQPKELVKLTGERSFQELTWEEASEGMIHAGAHKYCDLNIVNLLSARSQAKTVEFRIIGSTIDPEETWKAISDCYAILKWAKSKEPLPEVFDFTRI
jgi:hypothetical protein